MTFEIVDPRGSGGELADLEQSLKYERDKREAQHAEVSAKIDHLADGLRDGIDAGIRRMKGSDNYYTRTQLGKLMAPVVSAKRMTLLFRAAGIVSQYGDPMARYREGTEPLAKLKPFSEHEVWLFHIDKSFNKLNDWLEENDLYDDFHNTANKTERDRMIDEIYEDFVGDLFREDKR